MSRKRQKPVSSSSSSSSKSKTITIHSRDSDDSLQSEVSSTTSSCLKRRRSSRLQVSRESLKVRFLHMRPQHKSHKRDLEFVVELIARQLKNMPREYCRALVMLKKFNYQTLCLTDERSEVVLNKRRSPSHLVGAVVYRYVNAKRKKLVELAYCVMLTEFQGNGYGRVLMTHLIEEMRAKKVECILTYADNDAIGYFRKHGFTLMQRTDQLDSVVSVPRKDWHSTIFHYDGAQLMYCPLQRRNRAKNEVAVAMMHSSAQSTAFAGLHPAVAPPPIGRGKGALSVASSTASRRMTQDLGVRTPQSGWLSRISSTAEFSDVSPSTSLRSATRSKKRKFDFDGDTVANDSRQRKKRRRLGAISEAVIATAIESDNTDSVSESESLSVDESSSFTGGSGTAETRQRQSVVESSSSTKTHGGDDKGKARRRQRRESVSSSMSLMSAAQQWPAIERPLYTVTDIVATECFAEDSAAWRRRLRRRSSLCSPQTHKLKITAVSSVSRQLQRVAGGDASKLNSLKVCIADKNAGKFWDEIESFVRFERLASAHSDFDIIAHLRDYYQLSEVLIKKVLTEINETPDRMVVADCMRMHKCWIVTVQSDPSKSPFRVRFFRKDHSNELLRFWTGVELRQESRFTIHGKPDLLGWFYVDTDKSPVRLNLYGSEILSYVLPFEMEATERVTHKTAHKIHMSKETASAKRSTKTQVAAAAKKKKRKRKSGKPRRSARLRSKAGASTKTRKLEAMEVDSDESVDESSGESQSEAEESSESESVASEHSSHRQWFKLPRAVLRELCWRNHAEFRYCLNFANSDFLDFYDNEFT